MHAKEEIADSWVMPRIFSVSYHFSKHTVFADKRLKGTTGLPAWLLSSSELILSIWAVEAESTPGKAVKLRWVKYGEETLGHNTFESAIILHGIFIFILLVSSEAQPKLTLLLDLGIAWPTQHPKNMR